jgi:hypothetical protein
MSFSVKKFIPDDWCAFKTIRLEALTTDPFVFIPSTDETRGPMMHGKLSLRRKLQRATPVARWSFGLSL